MLKNAIRLPVPEERVPDRTRLHPYYETYDYLH